MEALPSATSRRQALGPANDRVSNQIQLSPLATKDFALCSPSRSGLKRAAPTASIKSPKDPSAVLLKENSGSYTFPLNQEPPLLGREATAQPSSDGGDFVPLSKDGRLKQQLEAPSIDSSPIGTGLLERKLQRSAARWLRKLDVGQDDDNHVDWANHFVDGVLEGVLSDVLGEMQGSLPAHPSAEKMPSTARPIAVVAAAGAQTGRAAHNLLAHSPSMGISEEDKLAIIAGQHATPVDIFRQLSTKGTKDEAPGSELHEQEASVDEDELLHGQPPFRIVPYGDTPTGKGEATHQTLLGREATHQTLLGPQVSHGGGLASPVSLEAMLERQTYNPSIYSPSMGITQHEHERMREENAGPADMVAATGIVPFALAAPLHTRLETGLVNTCALGLEGTGDLHVSPLRCRHNPTPSHPRELHNQMVYTPSMGMSRDEVMDKRAQHAPHFSPTNLAYPAAADADQAPEAVAAAHTSSWRWLAGAAAVAGLLWASAKR